MAKFIPGDTEENLETIAEFMGATTGTLEDIKKELSNMNARLEPIERHVDNVKFLVGFLKWALPPGAIAALLMLLLRLAKV